MRTGGHFARNVGPASSTKRAIARRQLHLKTTSENRSRLTWCSANDAGGSSRCSSLKGECPRRTASAGPRGVTKRRIEACWLSVDSEACGERGSVRKIDSPQRASRRPPGAHRGAKERSSHPDTIDPRLPTEVLYSFAKRTGSVGSLQPSCPRAQPPRRPRNDRSIDHDLQP